MAHAAHTGPARPAPHDRRAAHCVLQQRKRRHAVARRTAGTGNGAAGYADGKPAATVILSNHFLRYALVPWRAELADAKEDLSFARHCFTKVYGKAAQQWKLRLSQEARKCPGWPARWIRNCSPA